MDNLTFDEYYKGFRFSKYPFRDRTAEKEDTSLLFIKPEQYSMLLDAFNDKQTCIIDGNRGTGKTIIIDDLKRRLDNTNLVAYITNFEKISLSNNCLDFYNLILQEVTRSFFGLFRNK